MGNDFRKRYLEEVAKEAAKDAERKRLLDVEAEERRQKQLLIPEFQEADRLRKSLIEKGRNRMKTHLKPRVERLEIDKVIDTCQSLCNNPQDSQRSISVSKRRNYFHVVPNLNNDLNARNLAKFRQKMNSSSWDGGFNWQFFPDLFYYCEITKKHFWRSHSEGGHHHRGQDRMVPARSWSSNTPVGKKLMIFYANLPSSRILSAENFYLYTQLGEDTNVKVGTTNGVPLNFPYYESWNADNTPVTGEFDFFGEYDAGVFPAGVYGKSLYSQPANPRPEDVTSRIVNAFAQFNSQNFD